MRKTLQFKAAKEFVNFGKREKEQGARESISGPGSSLSSSAATRKLLSICLNDIGVASILDLGCGDWNWMRELRLVNAAGAPVSYQGWEADETLVGELNAAYGTPTCLFSCSDIVTEDYPDVDLIIARDILFHLPIELSERVLAKVRDSARFLLSTSFLGVPQNSNIQQYNHIVNWGFYKINLNVHPFNLAENMKIAFREDENSHSGNQRYICLYEF